MDGKGGKSLENNHRDNLLFSVYLLETALSCGFDIDFGDCIDFIIEKLLSLSHVFNIPDSNGSTPLMCAAAFAGQPYLFNFLIARGLDYTLKDSNGWSLLHHAAAGGSNVIIEQLLSLELDIDSRDNNGRTPLMTAACSKQLQSFRFLIEQGSDPLLKDNNGTGAFVWAVQSIGKDSIAKLLSPSSTPFQQVQTAIILAISKYDESSSMIFARDVDRTDGTGYGQVFQLKNENGFIWENGRIRAENLEFGSRVIYWDYGDFNSYTCTYLLKCATEPQVGQHTNHTHHETIWNPVIQFIPPIPVHRKHVRITRTCTCI